MKKKLGRVFAGPVEERRIGSTPRVTVAGAAGAATAHGVCRAASSSSSSSRDLGRARGRCEAGMFVYLFKLKYIPKE